MIQPTASPAWPRWATAANILLIPIIALAMLNLSSPTTFAQLPVNQQHTDPHRPPADQPLPPDDPADDAPAPGSIYDPTPRDPGLTPDRLAPGPATPPEAASAPPMAAEDAEQGRAMTIPEVVIIAVVEGVTEFLPVSSTGHILLVQRMLGIPQTDAADAFAVAIQGGAILAILGLYYRRTRQLALGLVGKDPVGFRLGVHLFLAFAPFGMLAFLFYERVKGFFGLWQSVAGWFLGGLVILAVVRYRRGIAHEKGLGMEDLTWRLALIIGVIQCASMWPGTSRALVAILGGLAVGMSMKAAVEFSFLLGVITLLAAAGYDTLLHGGAIIHEYGVLVPILGLAVAAIAAAAAVKWMVHHLERYSMAIFGYYRIAIAIVVAILLLTGTLNHH